VRLHHRSSSPHSNPPGLTTGTDRVLRGGGFTASGLRARGDQRRKLLDKSPLRPRVSLYCIPRRVICWTSGPWSSEGGVCPCLRREAAHRGLCPPQIARLREPIIYWIAVKTFKNLYPQIYDFAGLHAAWRRARCDRRDRAAVAEFEFDLERNLPQMQDELRSHTYAPGGHTHFTIHELKRRLVICVLDHHDRRSGQSLRFQLGLRYGASRVRQGLRGAPAASSP